MSSGEGATLPEALGRHLVNLRRNKRELIDEVKVLQERVRQIENCLELSYLKVAPTIYPARSAVTNTTSDLGFNK